tara:strand:- start:9982 stop:10329 length:348 start_codon:yes stop_codon:yes gene_type:complete
MSTEFQQNIKSWVEIDNQIKKMTDTVKELRERRNNIQDHITSYAEENQLDNAIIEISDGSLRFNNYKQSAPLTFKYIQKCLNECISDEDTVDKLMNYIKEKREFKYQNGIKRSYK